MFYGNAVVLPSLHVCLARTKYDVLLTSAQYYKLVTLKGRKFLKSSLITQLAVKLQTPNTIRKQWRRLNKVERDSILTLIERRGTAPFYEFTQRFGTFQQLLPRRQLKKVKSPSSPTPSTRLAYLGWIFPYAEDGQKHPTHVVIPAEIYPLLPKVVRRRAAVTTTAPLLPDPTILMYDLTLWLNHLHHTPTARLRTGTPPLATLRHVNEHLRDPASLATVRRVGRAGRTAFLAFLAEAAALVTPDSPITLTPAAWHWLDGSPEYCLQTLWQAWCHPAPTLWQKYSQPSLPVGDFYSLQTALIEGLATLPHNTAYTVEGWCRALIRRDDRFWYLTPWWEREVGKNNALSFLSALLTGPLHWFGIIALHPDNRTFSLTPTGAWLLAQQTTPAPVWRPSAPASIQPDGTIRVPLTIPPALLFHLAALAEWNPPDGYLALYRLTPAAIGHAYARGYTLADIYRYLALATQSALPTDLKKRLSAWWAQSRPIRLQRVTLLEVSDPDILAELSRAAVVRRALRHTLHPRTAIVAESQLPALIRHLQAQGHAISTPLPTPTINTPPAAFALAAAIYRLVAPTLGLTATLPATLINQAVESLDDITRTHIDRLGDQAAHRLQRLIEGDSTHAAPVITPPDPALLAYLTTRLAATHPDISPPFTFTYCAIHDETPSPHTALPPTARTSLSLDGGRELAVHPPRPFG